MQFTSNQRPSQGLFHQRFSFDTWVSVTRRKHLRVPVHTHLRNREGTESHTPVPTVPGVSSLWFMCFKIKLWIRRRSITEPLEEWRSQKSLHYIQQCAVSMQPCSTLCSVSAPSWLTLTSSLTQVFLNWERFLIKPLEDDVRLTSSFLFLSFFKKFPSLQHLHSVHSKHNLDTETIFTGSRQSFIPTFKTKLTFQHLDPFFRWCRYLVEVGCSTVTF